VEALLEPVEELPDELVGLLFDPVEELPDDPVELVEPVLVTAA
jgi:hypothetical protein